MFLRGLPRHQNVINDAFIALCSLQKLSYDTLKLNTSGPEVIPKGSLVKRYRPNGVINVVKNELSSFKGICQNPASTSSLANTLRFAILQNVPRPQEPGIVPS